MPVRFAKTALGRGEIQSRAHALTRTARNLLLILDASRTGEAWVGMVHGASPADVQALLDAGLIEAVADAAPAPALQAGEGREADDTVPASDAFEPTFAPTQAEGAPALAFTSLSYSELNTRLNVLIKAHLGLIKGYRFTLDVERATDVIELQRVALRLVAEVESAHGVQVAAVARQTLGLAG
ncbi:MAG: hypothetical protein IIA02_07350 [Proteobacteria bacterium]|uniref:hypothetical protein n=1 Tax=Aquabacterium sp. TaxID=1872578 RepID=UPI0035C6A772|nr:hypothetical protein [Pseudomonadota bacterium]